MNLVRALVTYPEQSARKQPRSPQAMQKSVVELQALSQASHARFLFN
ncbi:hypothetical protein J2X19_001215 [Rhodoferax ferrireducens]|uniref:Uncharacterized protein n=1 Tax=Rhodoferax ferrireducens TaxID=192843 RepID=A0ABU2C5F7_9BURK|nr:hypothetical protein [Rhodoferax ferrireducens]